MQGRACSSMPDVREFVGRGLSAITEVERLLPHTDFNDHRLQPLLKVVILHTSFLILWVLRILKSFKKVWF